MRDGRLGFVRRVALIAVVMVLCLVPWHQARAAESVVTRAQWVADLVETFDLTVEEENYPDFYFTDITAQSPSYDVVMCATDFGIVDIPSGQPFRPDDPLTREFAAETLNYCLGFQVTDEGWTYTDFENVAEAYRDDVQVAVRRGWFALDDGAVHPSDNVTPAEAEAMLADAKGVLRSTEEYASASTDIEFKDGVKVVSGASAVAIDEDETVVSIVDNPVPIAQGDIFVAYFNGFPAAFRAASVSVEGNVTSIAVTAVAHSDAFEAYSFRADDDIDLTAFDPAEGVRATKGSKDASRSILLIANNDYGFETDFTSVELNLSDVRADYFYNGLTENIYLDLCGQSVVTSSVGMSGEGSKPLGVLQYGPLALSLDVDYGLEGKLAATVPVSFHISVVYNPDDGLRLVPDFSSGGAYFSGEAQGRVGLSARVALGLVGAADVGVSAGFGVEANYTKIPWGDGQSPYVCENVEAHLYAEAVASINVAGSAAIETTRSIWDADNSPKRAGAHIEDGVEVDCCTRGVDFGQYFGKYGTMGSGNTGWAFDADGNRYSFGIYEYTVDENGDATITDYFGIAFALVIPDTLGGHPVVGIGNDVFKDDLYLMSVLIPDTVRNIGGRAFSGCSSLTQINLPSSLETLGASAFATCPITSITVPASLESCHYIYPPFANCGKLKTVRFAQGVTKVATGLFGDCPGIESVDIPEGVTVIDDNAFDGCENLASVSLPSTLLSIEKAAFANCPQLTGVVLPASLTTLGASAFANCDNITSIAIPASLESCHYINPPFSGCDALTEFIFAEGVTRVAAGLMSECPGLVSVTVPDGVTAIDQNAFEDSVNLSSVNLPSTLTSIGTNAFSGCTSLVSITLPDSLDTLGAKAFLGCSALSDVNVPANVKAIEQSVFQGCGALETVVLPYGVTVIRASAFADCPNLAAVTIPRATTSIQGTAFNNDASLTVYGVAGSYAETFANNKGIPFVAIEVGTTDISLSPTEVTLGKKETLTVSALVLPIDATGEFVWTSADTSVATVDSSGKITAKGGGATTVTLTVGNMSASVRVTVLQAVTDISLNASSMMLGAGGTFRLAATVSPSDATNPALAWTSSDPSVATVDEAGLVTAVNVGSATITAAATDGSGVSKSCAVTVTKDLSGALVEALDQTYTGEALEPDVTVTLDGVALVADTDYTLAFSDNTEVGMATITVSGKGYYTGVATGYFEILAASHAPGWATENGWYFYYNNDGTLLTDDWVSYGGKWYYMDESGALVWTGVCKYQGKYYYVKSGTVQTSKSGWKQVGSDWYCFNGAYGSAWQNQWYVYGKSYYYLKGDGKLAISEWAQYNGKWYHFNAKGVCDRVWNG